MSIRTAGKIALLTFSLAVPHTAQSLSGNPDDHFVCDEAESFSRYTKTQCTVADAAYIAPTASWEYPVAFIAPQAPGPHRIKVKLSGFNARPYAFCTGLDFASDNFIVVKPCAAHFPDLTMHDVNGLKPLGWWGWYMGPSNSMRIGLSITKAANDMDADVAAGITLEGTSYGGTGAILQSMMLRQADPWWGELIAVVRADIPHTNFVANWLNYDPVDLAWQGYDRRGADIGVQMANGAVDDIYYRVNGSPADTQVIFDLQFFRDCNRYRIACFGTWHNQGHGLSEPGVNLPYGALYPSDKADVRLDRMLPVFTNSTANHWGEQRGHYNLGLSWHSGFWFFDASDTVALPIRYKAHRNIGGGIPDQPDEATFDITIRRIENFSTDVGSRVHWSLVGYASGEVNVTREGEVTITGLTLPDGDNYVGLVLTHASATTQ